METTKARLVANQEIIGKSGVVHKVTEVNATSIVMRFEGNADINEVIMTFAIRLDADRKEARIEAYDFSTEAKELAKTYAITLIKVKAKAEDATDQTRGLTSTDVATSLRHDFDSGI